MRTVETGIQIRIVKKLDERKLVTDDYESRWCSRLGYLPPVEWRSRRAALSA